MDPVESFDRAAAAASAVVTNITDGQVGLPTPCEKWDVRAVLNHLVGANLRVVATVRGETPPDPSADHLGTHPKDAFAASLAAVRAVFAEPGVLERIYPTPIGEQPGVFLVHMRVNELLVHAWDVAVATGQSTDIAPQLADNALAMWRTRLAQVPRPPDGPFAEERPVPEGATAADRLAAFLGRTVPTHVGPG